MNFLILALLSLVVTAITSAIGFTSGGLQMLDFINAPPDRDERRKRIRRLVVITLSLTVIFTLAGIPSFLSSLSEPKSGGNPSPTPVIAQITPNATSVSTPDSRLTPSPAPTQTPEPIPTPELKTYKADWSKGMDGWVQSAGWSSVNGMLVNDGQDYDNDGHPTVTAPAFSQSVNNYSVQVDIRLDRYTDAGTTMSGLASFGLVVRSPDQVGGYKLGVCASAGIYGCGNNSGHYALMLSNGSFFQDHPIAESQFRATVGKWDTYRIDVKGNTITVWQNNNANPLFQVTDSKYLSAGKVGFWSYRSQISLQNFTITSLL